MADKPKARRPRVRWLGEPEDHDYDAAELFLSLIMRPADAEACRRRLSSAGKLSHYQAKDILRAAGLPLLPQSNKHVAADLAKIAAGEALSPVLLIRGTSSVEPLLVRAGTPLTIADGTHRVMAAWWTDENAVVPCVIV